jgi:hypothetical protein
VSFATLADILMIMDMDAFGSFRREGERVIATTKTIAVNSRNNPKKSSCHREHRGLRVKTGRYNKQPDSFWVRLL